MHRTPQLLVVAALLLPALPVPAMDISGLAAPAQGAAVLILPAEDAALTGPPADLLGTRWEWLSFKSASEEIAVEDPTLYTMEFLPEGVALGADCNRASGGVGSASPGEIRFGVMAMTMAMCPEGSLSNRFAADVGAAVSYLLGEDRLELALPAEGGVLTFRKAD